MKKLINYFAEKQKMLFLMDSIGAFVTAFFLFVVMLKFNAHFGMPKNELACLTVIAVCFCIYSAACFLFLRKGLTPFMRGIGIANLIYCALTIGLLINYYSVLTFIGIAYFVVEMVIICGLSYVELMWLPEIKINRYYQFDLWFNWT